MSGSLPRRALLLAPTAAALLGGTALWLLSERRLQPPILQLGSARQLVGKALPLFAMAGLPGRPGFSNSDVAGAGHVVLINFFASWCMPCRQELPVLQHLAHGGLAIWGIDYRDTAAAADGFLRTHGDPYRRIGSDEAGSVADRFGVVGVPESFLVDRGGVVRWHWIGGLSEDTVRHYLDPLLHPAG